MKKIALSKETLRVLTAQETAHVAGGLNTRAVCETAWDHQCVTQAYSCADTCTGDTGASVGCPPQTQNCATQGCATQGCTTGTGTGTTGTGTGGTTTSPPTQTV